MRRVGKPGALTEAQWLTPWASVRHDAWYDMYEVYIFRC